ncbi:MAG: hypothetical protein GY820_42270 [Gammaproteobacteria bacterium]|nr:hypothetical protein [Gammaproteobacteria bacterium]
MDELEGHAVRHLKNELEELRRKRGLGNGANFQPKGRCLYCSYVGKSLTAARVHITWRHKGSESQRTQH